MNLVAHRVRRTRFARRAKAGRHYPRPRLLAHPHHIGDVAVQYGGARCRELLHHPRLLGARHIERAKTALLLAADRSDNGHVWTGDLSGQVFTADRSTA